MKLGVYLPETVKDESCAIIMPNRLVGAHADDLGTRAQIVADAVALPVFAYERDGTATAPKVESFSPTSIRSEISRRADILARATEAYSTVHAIGHSAAASEIILLAETGILPFDRIVALDPVMMESRQFVGGAKDWLREQVLKKYNPIPFFEGVPRGPEITDISFPKAVHRGIKEYRTYNNVLWTDIAFQGLKNIDENQRASNVSVYVGGDSDVLCVDTLMAEFGDSDVVDVQVIPGANHSFPEPYGHFVHFAEKHL